MAPLPDPTRVITSTNPKTGLSTTDKSQAEPLPVTQTLAGALFRLAYVSSRAPQRLHNETDQSTYSTYLSNPPPLVAPGGGSAVWYVDIPPASSSAMHRTMSLDFVVIVEGELELILSSGETRLLKPGDTVIQRGTMHQWTNHSQDRWARMLAIMAASEPIVLEDGTELGLAGLA